MLGVSSSLVLLDDPRLYCSTGICTTSLDQPAKPLPLLPATGLLIVAVPLPASGMGVGFSCTLSPGSGLTLAGPGASQGLGMASTCFKRPRSREVVPGRAQRTLRLQSREVSMASFQLFLFAS